MAVLGIDLGGTKLAYAIFSEDGAVLSKETVPLGRCEGHEVGMLITDLICRLLKSNEKQENKILSIGISVPGISNSKSATVWAPNIPGWTDYPLLKEVTSITGGLPVAIDNDRACYILGELWQGNARGCRDAIFLAVGTGIGAGIVVNGEVLRGSNDIAGATGWMALSRPFENHYTGCGCFEYHASGEGIAKVARSLLSTDNEYRGELRTKTAEKITSHDIFEAFGNGDLLAKRVIDQAVEYWGMAVANFISLFNPEKIIFGGGVFGPARSLIPEIAREAAKWAQPVSITQVSFDVSGLEGDAGVYGAGFLALKNIKGS